MSTKQAGCMNLDAPSDPSHVLIAKEKGLYCPVCAGFYQNWVHDGMANGSARRGIKQWVALFTKNL